MVLANTTLCSQLASPRSSLNFELVRRIAATKLGLCFLCLCLFLIAPHVAQAEEKGPFKVGVIIPLTGDLADYGTSIQRGFELAVEQSPLDFAKIRFIFEDSRYDGNTAVSAFQKLRNNDSVDLYYAWGVSPTEALIPITQLNKLPLLVETTLKESTARKNFVIRAARTGERIAKALATQLHDRKVRKVSFIVADVPFYDDILRHLKRILVSDGIEVTRVRTVLPSENDMRSYLPELKRTQEDAVGVFLLPAQIVSFFKRALETNFTTQTFGADIIGSESIIADCPNNVNGTFFSEVGVTQNFRDLYNRKYKSEGHIGHAAQAFDVANLIAHLFGRGEHPAPEEIISALSRISPQKGATGEFRFSETPDGGKELRMPVAIKIIREKRIETIVEDSGF